MWIKSSRVIRASDCQCKSCNSPGFIQASPTQWNLRAADKAVLNKVHKSKNKKSLCKNRITPPPFSQCPTISFLSYLIYLHSTCLCMDLYLTSRPLSSPWFDGILPSIENLSLAVFFNFHYNFLSHAFCWRILTLGLSSSINILLTRIQRVKKYPVIRVCFIFTILAMNMWPILHS